MNKNVSDNAELFELIGNAAALHMTQAGQLNNLLALVSTGAFKYSSAESRKTVIDNLLTLGDNIDAMSRQIAKGLKKIKREKLRDDDAITMLVHRWAETGGDIDAYKKG